MPPIRRRALAPLVALIALAAPTAGRGASRDETPRLEDLAARNVTDLEATVKVERAEIGELQKISRDWAILYQLRDVTVRYKEPDKVRMENRVGLFILNDPHRYLRVPALGLTRRDDLGESLSRRYSLFDLGVITQRAATLLQSRFLRTEGAPDGRIEVFEVCYRGNDSARYVVWIDPKRHVVVKRQWFDGDGTLRAEFQYQAPAECAPGVWVPTRVLVRNGSGTLAGITAYHDVRVNQGLSEDLFLDARPPTAAASR